MEPTIPKLAFGRSVPIARAALWKLYTSATRARRSQQSKCCEDRSLWLRLRERGDSPASKMDACACSSSTSTGCDGHLAFSHGVSSKNLQTRPRHASTRYETLPSVRHTAREQSRKTPSERDKGAIQ